MLRIIAFQRSNIPPEFRVPTYLFIDEFQNFISADIEKGLTQLRKYGLHLILANQYIGQVSSPALQKALFSAGIQIAGKNERNSLRAITRELDVPVHTMTNMRV
jgi:type IV secretory pathway VirB4 component